MWIAIWSPQGIDEGYILLDNYDRFKLEYDSDSPDTYNLITKQGSSTKVWKISPNSYHNIKEFMSRESL
ncbi:hypothetical protein LCGC14_0997070 [marine sediment metagenome]|uniref:Uncharacterized protein n=1 Tax=marine sediment metagenome TaxID=412755 RepID=A0A0F9RAC9_9ZZZZ